MHNGNGYERVRDCICECKELLFECLSERLQNGAPIVNEAYVSYVVGKTKHKPDEAITKAFDELQFILESFSLYEEMTHLYQMDEGDQCDANGKDMSVIEDARKQVYARLSQYGVSVKWLASHGMVSKQDLLLQQQYVNSNEFKYKKIKGGIRIDSTTIAGGIVVPDFIDGLPVIKIGKSAFAKRKDITSIILPQFLAEIETGAFAGSGLVSIKIPDNVENIGENAFRDCKQLQRVTLPQKIKVIRTHTFSGCSGLITVKIPEGTTAISERAFAQCKNLRTIQIPSSVTRMGFAAIPLKTVIYCDLQSRAGRYVADHNMPLYQPFEMYADE